MLLITPMHHRYGGLRGKWSDLQVAETLSRTKESAVEAHARDELGIDLEDLANPMQVTSLFPSDLCHS